MVAPARTGGATIDNETIASQLEEVAERLESRADNPFRVRAYRLAASAVRDHRTPIWRVATEDGVVGLMRIPGIGRSLSRTIERLVRTGRMPVLVGLRRQQSPEWLLTTVADIGPGLARRIYRQLGVETLWELEVAAHDGRLATVPGMGKKRLRAVRESLAGRAREYGRRPENSNAAENQVPVAELLDLDREYRRLAAADRLPRIAPRQNNPTRQAWLPMLRTHRGERRYTILFSNTAHAHAMGTTRDWVVIYSNGTDGRWTVITSRLGALRGKRIVRGRERQCADYYAASLLPPSTK